MFFWFSCLLWSFVALVVFIKLYIVFEGSCPALPTGRTLLAAVSTSKFNTQRNSHLTMIVFCLNYKKSPARDELKEISDDITDLFHSEEVFADDDVAQFIEKLKDDSGNPKLRIPIPSVIARGHDLVIANVQLNQGNFHPSYDQDRVIPIRVTGKSKGRVAHLHWFSDEAQEIFVHFGMAE